MDSQEDQRVASRVGPVRCTHIHRIGNPGIFGSRLEARREERVVEEDRTRVRSE